ncbi:MAG TPA: TonB-dependent receptor [Vicinamibacterales bacterium]|nr:TonB-dependent receptor [Vicinamibacterales bacterium]
MIRLRHLVTVAVVLLPPIAAAGAWQEGQIRGVVQDATRSGLPGATLTVTNQTTKQTRTVTTAADGSYTLSVPPGRYEVSVSATGFAIATQVVDVAPGGSGQADFLLQTQLSEQITVTATKREQTLLDVPFSVAAPTEELLRARGVDSIEGVAANVGGFTVQNLGPGQSQVAMRGVSAGQIVRDQPGVKEQVGIYLDESVLSFSLFTPDLDFFDTNRIEVLRGPQGTLFGSGSLSGTVRYITNQPELGVTRGFSELTFNGLNDGGFGGNVKFGFNVPVGDKAAVRVASYYDRIAGYMDAVQPDLGVQDDVNDGFRGGVRAAVRIAPNERTAITPRIVYQRVKMDGWNRIDEYNILANPFTTTRPPVTLGDRSQFTQLGEEFTDDFVLADLNIDHEFGELILTSITSYTYRDILVVRDAGALTSSITATGSLAQPENVYTLDAPLNDATTANAWTQELRVAGGADRYPWVAGLFYSHVNRDYGQSLPVIGFEDLSGIATTGLRAPKDTLFFSDLGYKFNQFALFGEVTVSATEQLSFTGGLRYYNFSEDKEQVFDGIFAHDDTGVAVVSQPGETDADGLAPRLIATYKLSDITNLNAQISRGFRLGGVNDPLNVPLCTPEDLVTFSGRETWDDETVWNYEVGVKSRVLNNKGAVGVAAFYMDITDLQATVTAGECSSRIVFNVPDARSRGFEIEFEAAPTDNFDFAISGSFTDSELRSTVTSTDEDGVVSVVSGIEEGRRLPTVPRFQLASAATYQWEVRPGALAYVTGTYQHIGSRFTQVGDEELGTLDLLSFEPHTIGGPLTATVFTYDPKLPGYDLLNLRVGLRRAGWDVAFFLNNVTNERALLSFDQERGTRARIAYMTNQPRTFGIATRFDF